MGATAASTRLGKLRQDMLQPYMVRAWRVGEVIFLIILEYVRRL